MKPVTLLICHVALLSTFAVASENPSAPAPTPFVMNVVGNVAPAEQKKVLDALATNYVRIAADLKTAAAQPFNIYYYDSRWGYAKATGNWGASGSIEGTSKMHLMPTSRSGGKAEAVAVHEFTHAVVLKLLVDNEPQPLDKANFDSKFAKFPVWLWEGIAAYEAREFIHPKHADVTRDSHPSLDELSDRSRGGKIYKVGYTVIEYLLAEHGQDGLIKLVLAWGDLGVLKTNNKDFAKGWHEFVVKKYF
jgi:hypothetical protein